jgi:hypothetical protein
MNGQVLHSSTEKQLELVRHLSKSGYLQKQVGHAAAPCPCLSHKVAGADPVVLLQVLPLLKTGTQAWQPSDFLPASQDPDFEDKVCVEGGGGAGLEGHA